MNARDAVRRIRAFQKGQPLPRGETLHLHMPNDDDVLIVAFVRMGGESRPWGVAFGHAGDTPTMLSVPEARDRDLVAQMSAAFAPTLLAHLRTPGWTADDPAEWSELDPLRQVWLPNPSHLDMLHHIAYAYTFTRWGGELQPTLNALGRACGWLFREAQRPGTMAIFTATQALRDAFTFPSEEVRQGHLGFLLAWLNTRGSRDRRIAAALKAEREAIATNLDPDIERQTLQPLVEQWGAAEKEGKTRAGRKARTAIHEVLSAEMERRWKLTENAFERLCREGRRVNAGVSELARETLKEQWYQHTRLELRLSSGEDGPAFFPSPETDRHPAAAASRFLVHSASADLVESLLVHDDGELLAEAIAGGDAFRGEVVAVRNDGQGKRRPVWTIRDKADRQLRIRTGAYVCVVGLRKREGRVIGFAGADDGALLIQVAITGRVTRDPTSSGVHGIDPISNSLVGHTIAFVTKPLEGIPRRKSRRVWERSGPGAWLTHGVPGGTRARALEDAGDDLAQIEASAVPE